jgi:hypothetical protein
MRAGIIRAGIAGVAAAGLLGIGAGAAFAADPPPAGLTLNASVPTTESISLATTTEPVSLVPGGTNQLAFAAPGPMAEFVTYTTNDADGYTGQVSEPTPLATAHGTSIPDTDVAPFVWSNLPNGTGSFTPFDASGDGVTLITTSAPSGGFGTGGTDVTSASGSDVLNTNLGISTPANQAGGAYSTTFDYSIIGNA